MPKHVGKRRNSLRPSHECWAGKGVGRGSRNHRSRGKSPCAPEEQAIELLAQEDDTLKEKELCFSIVTDLKRATSTA